MDFIKITKYLDQNGFYKYADHLLDAFESGGNLDLKFHKDKPPTATPSGDVIRAVERFLRGEDLKLFKVRDYYPLQGGMDALIGPESAGPMLDPNGPSSQADRAKEFFSGKMWRSVFFNGSDHMDSNNFTLDLPSDPNHPINLRKKGPNALEDYMRDHEIPEGKPWSEWYFGKREEHDKPPFDLE